MTQEITVEATSVKDAREQVRPQIPDGYSILFEKICTDERPVVVRKTAKTVEEAFETADREIPSDFLSKEKQTICEPISEKMIIEAYSEDEARESVRKQIMSYAGGRDYSGKYANKALGKFTVGSKIISIQLKLPGKKGFLGIGKKPDQFEIEIFQEAKVQITYTLKTKIVFTIGKADIEENWNKMKKGLIPGEVQKLAGKPYQELTVSEYMKKFNVGMITGEIDYAFLNQTCWIYRKKGNSQDYYLIIFKSGRVDSFEAHHPSWDSVLF